MILVNIIRIISQILGKTFCRHSANALCLLGWPKKENNTNITNCLAVNKVICV